MNQGDGKRPFANRGRDSLDRLGADIPGHEDTRDAGFKQVWLSLQIPRCRPLATAGQAEPVTTKPLASRTNDGGSQSVSGAAPMNKEVPRPTTPGPRHQQK